jgi:hypothetical protein
MVLAMIAVAASATDGAGERRGSGATGDGVALRALPDGPARGFRFWRACLGAALAAWGAPSGTPQPVTRGVLFG